MSQAALILAHLRSGKTLTPLGALREFGCMRLGARIYDLRLDGYDIEMRRVPKWGRRGHYAEYRLKPSGDEADA